MTNQPNALTQALSLALAVGATFALSLITLPVLEQPAQATPCWGSAYCE